MGHTPKPESLDSVERRDGAPGLAESTETAEPTAKAAKGEAVTTNRSQAGDLAALAALYEADRAEATSTLGVAFALLGLAVAYVTGTLAFASAAFGYFGQWSVIVPFPLWIIAAFHSLITTAAMVRSLSIRAVERALLENTSFSKGQAPSIGMQATERILNITEAHWAHRVASVLAYGGVAAMIVGYTIFFVLDTPHIGGLGQIVAALIYLVLACLIVASWLAGFRTYKENYAVLAHEPAKTLREA